MNDANSSKQGSGQDWLAVARDVFDAELEGLAAVRGKLAGGFLAAMDLLSGCAGRVVVTGLGKSGLVGRKLAATLSSTGTPSFFLHPVEGAHGDLGMIQPGDVAVAISNSGETDELNAILPTLRSLGASIIALTGNMQSSMAIISDVVIDCGVPREADPSGLAPTASTTAALAVGDALAVCLMQHKCFGEQDFKRYHPGGALGRRLQAKVSEIMRSDDLPSAPVQSPARDALATLNAGGLGAVVVVDAAGAVQGILTDGDLRRALAREMYDPDQPVEEYMTVNPCTAQPEQAVAELLDIMEARAITVLPVVDSANRLIGVAHLHDLLGKGRIKFSG